MFGYLETALQKYVKWLYRLTELGEGDRSVINIKDFRPISKLLQNKCTENGYGYRRPDEHQPN